MNPKALFFGLLFSLPIWALVLVAAFHSHLFGALLCICCLVGGVYVISPELRTRRPQ